MLRGGASCCVWFSRGACGRGLLGVFWPCTAPVCMSACVRAHPPAPSPTRPAGFVRQLLKDILADDYDMELRREMALVLTDFLSGEGGKTLVPHLLAGTGGASPGCLRRLAVGIPCIPGV
jgi:hypothetical protein